MRSMTRRRSTQRMKKTRKYDEIFFRALVDSRVLSDGDSVVAIFVVDVSNKRETEYIKKVYVVYT